MRSTSPAVRAVDLSRPLPYAEQQFQFIYASHVVDHFSIDRIRDLLKEFRACLQPGGVLRLSAPDLEHAAKQYVKSVSDNELDPRRHHWFTIELLDQIARTEPGGEKAKFLRRARSQPDVQEWLRPMLGIEMRLHLDDQSVSPSWKRRLRAIASRLPIARRSVEKSGERHYWFFDSITLGQMLREAGFAHIERSSWNQSLSAGYLAENLDMQDGSEYKPGSLYMEARR